MPHYAVRITLPYDSVSSVISVWSDACDKVTVFEHQMDEDISQTHVHLAMYNCQYATAEALKRRFYKIINTDRKGNELWSWKSWDGSDTYLTYMTKGNLDAKYLKGWNETDVNEWKSKWITPTAQTTTTNEKKLSKYEIVQAVYGHFLAKCPILVTGKRDESKLHDVTDVDLIKCIRRTLIDNEQALGLYKVMDIYDAWIMYFQKEKFVDNCLKVIEKRQPRV